MAKRAAAVIKVTEPVDILKSLFDFPEIASIVMSFLDPRALGRSVLVCTRWHTFIYKLWGEREFCFLSFQNVLKRREMHQVEDSIEATQSEQRQLDHLLSIETRNITLKYTPRKDPNQPKRPATAYQIFSHEKRPFLKEAGFNASAIQRQLSADWKTLDAKGKAKYERVNQAEKKKYEAAMEKWRSSVPKEQQKPYLDQQKKLALEKWRKEHAERVKAKDFPGTIAKYQCNMQSIRQNMQQTETLATQRAMQFYAKTRHQLTTAIPVWQPAKPKERARHVLLKKSTYFDIRQHAVRFARHHLQSAFGLNSDEPMANSTLFDEFNPEFDNDAKGDANANGSNDGTQSLMNRVFGNYTPNSKANATMLMQRVFANVFPVQMQQLHNQQQKQAATKPTPPPEKKAWAANDRVKVMFTVDGVDGLYPGTIQKVVQANARRKTPRFYTIVFDGDDLVYTDIKEEELHAMDYEMPGQAKTDNGATKDGEAIVIEDDESTAEFGDEQSKSKNGTRQASPARPLPTSFPTKPDSCLTGNGTSAVPESFDAGLQFTTLDAFLKEAQDGDIVFLEEGRIPVQKLDYNDCSNESIDDESIGYKFNKNLALVGVGPKRSEFVARGSWADLLDYVEEDALYSISDNATVRFENITFTTGGYEAREMITFGIGTGATVYFVNCQFIGCSFTLSETANVYATKCLFTQRKHNLFDLQSQQCNVIIEDCLFCNNGVGATVRSQPFFFRQEMDDPRKYALFWVRELVTHYDASLERDPSQPIDLAAEEEAEAQGATAKRAPIANLQLRGCRFITNNHIVYFDEFRRDINWMFAQHHSDVMLPINVKKNNMINLVFEQNWVYDNKCQYCSNGQICPERGQYMPMPGDDYSDSDLDDSSDEMMHHHFPFLGFPWFGGGRGHYYYSSDDSSDW